MSIRYLVSYQREACLAVLGGSTVDMMTFSIWIVIKHFVLLAPSYIICGGCRVSFASFQVNAKTTTVKRLLGLDFKAVRRFSPSLRKYFDELSIRASHIFLTV